VVFRAYWVEGTNSVEMMVIAATKTYRRPYTFTPARVVMVEYAMMVPMTVTSAKMMEAEPTCQMTFSGLGCCFVER
jgi:hypothetical protein